MPRHKPSTRQERIEKWATIASKGHDGIYHARGQNGHIVVCVLEPDTRTPHERLDGMIAAGKKVGVELDPDFLAEVRTRLHEEA